MESLINSCKSRNDLINIEDVKLEIKEQLTNLNIAILHR